MKLVTSTEALKRAMISVQALLTEHQVILRADTGGNVLVVEAGQNGVYLKQCIPANVTQGGEVVINSTYISALQLSDKIELESTSKNTMEFSSGSLNGTLATHQDTQRIVDQRPLEDITIQVQLSKDIVTKAIAKANFNSPLTQTLEGLRIKLDENIAVSTTDSLRASLYKDKLPFKKATLDFVIKPTVLSLAIAKIEEPEVWIGLHRGTIKIASPSFEFFHPTIQAEPTDVEGWLNDMDRDSKAGEVTTNVQDLLKTFQAVTSITGSSSGDVKLICTFTGNQLVVTVGAAHGSAKASLQLTDSSCSNQKVTLHSKYTTEMLSMIKDGTVRMEIYNDFVILTSGDGKCTCIIPTTADQN
jgi:hypothetical protein